MIMSRMRSGEVAVLLARIGEQFPTEVEKLGAHMEALDAEDNYTRLAKEVGEVVGEQRAFMQSQQVLIQASTSVLDRIADQQKRSNDIESAKLELRKQMMKSLWQPIVAGIVGLLTGGIGTYFATLAKIAADAATQ